MRSISLLILVLISAHSLSNQFSIFFPENEVVNIEEIGMITPEISSHIISVDGIKTVVFYDKKNELLLAGSLIEKGGSNLLFKAMREHKHHFNKLLESNSTTAKESPGSFIKALEHIELSSAGSEENIYIVYDRLCPACVKLHNRIDGLPTVMKEKISWIPISILDGANGLSQNGNDLDKGTPFSSGLGTYSSSKGLVTKNTLILKQLGVTKTPTTIIVKNGKTLIHEGMPYDKLLVELQDTD